MPAGRPTSYKPEYADLAYKFCLLGATDERLANFFDVSVATLNNWKTTHPEFLESLKNGKEVADAEVSNSLYHRAKGYSHPEDKIFIHAGEPVIVPTIKHYPPDTAAICYWMNNRQKGLWSNVQKIEISDADKKPRELSRSEIEKELAAELKGKKAANG